MTKFLCALPTRRVKPALVSSDVTHPDPDPDTKVALYTSEENSCIKLDELNLRNFTKFSSGMLVYLGAGYCKMNFEDDMLHNTKLITIYDLRNRRMKRKQEAKNQRRMVKVVQSIVKVVQAVTMFVKKKNNT